MMSCLDTLFWRNRIASTLIFNTQSHRASPPPLGYNAALITYGQKKKIIFAGNNFTKHQSICNFYLLNSDKKELEENKENGDDEYDEDEDDIDQEQEDKEYVLLNKKYAKLCFIQFSVFPVLGG